MQPPCYGQRRLQSTSPLREGMNCRAQFTVRIGIHVPSRRGVAAAGGRGVSRMLLPRMAGAVRHTPRPSGRTPLREGTAAAHAICVADWYPRPLSERGGRREAVGVCPGCSGSVWLAPCDTPPALTGVPLSERGQLTRMLYGADWYLRPLSERGGRRRRTGCVSDAVAEDGWRRATHPPPCGRTPLREGTAAA